MEFIASESEERNFVEFRRKVRSAEVLSAAMERLLSSLHFTGRVSYRAAEWARAEIRLRGGLFFRSNVRA
jgi:hypothetical protein